MQNSVMSARLKELREKKGVSQAEVARYLGIERSTYSAYEAGKSRPVRYMDKIANFFGVSADYIMGRTDSPMPTEGNSQYLSESEKTLLAVFCKLNDTDKNKAADYINGLVEQNLYHDAKAVLSVYEQLNDAGRGEALKLIRLLLLNSDYVKEQG